MSEMDKRKQAKYLRMKTKMEGRQKIKKPAGKNKMNMPNEPQI